MDLNQLRRSRDGVLAAARARGAGDVRVFGSVARGDTHQASDVDILVRFEPGRSLLDQAHLIEDLTALLGVRVDVVAEGGLLPRDRHILEEAVVL